LIRVIIAEVEGNNIGRDGSIINYAELASTSASLPWLLYSSSLELV
jgi:hypothetical protein